MPRDARPTLPRFPGFASVLLTTSLAPAAAAQIAPVGVVPEQECAPGRIGRGNFICGPGGSLAACARLVARDLDGNLSPEVASLQGDRLVLFVNPDVGDEHVVVASGVLDVCAEVGKARFLFVTLQGLHALELGSGGVAVELLESGPSWKGARALRAHVDGSLLVLGADRRSVYSASGNGDGYALTLAFVATSDVRDLLALDWDGIPGAEVALLDAHGLQVRKGGGGLLLERKNASPGDALARVARAGKGDGVAWVTRLADKASYLFHFRPEYGAGFDGPVALGALRHDALAAGDLDADGDDDLVLGGRVGSSAPFLLNRATSTSEPAFVGLDGAFDLALEEGAALPGGAVLLHDLFNAHTASGGRRPALASLLLEPPGLRLVPPSDELESLAGVPGTSQHFQTVELVTALQRNGCDPGLVPPVPRALWSVTLGPDWPAQTATHVEAIVRVSLAAGLAPERVALHHSMTPIAPTGLPGTSVLMEGLEGPADAEDAGTCYFVQLRPVRLDAGATRILEAWPWHVVALSADCNGLAWTMTLPGAIPETCPIVVTSCNSILECPFGIPNGPGFRGPVYIPSAVPQLKVPSSGPGVLPIVWPWDY